MAKRIKDYLSVQLKAKLPRHVAVIMDGNGRWAQRRHLPRVAGHREGFKAAKRIVRACGEAGVEVLTLFAFGSENWRRPAEEVNYLLGLFLTALENEIQKLHRNNVQLRIIGECSRFDVRLQESIRTAQQLTANNTGLKLVVAVDYSGRWDLWQAMYQLARQIENKQLTADKLTPEILASHLMLADLPEPDLFIRTSGEQRISNFFLWQLAYTELYFTDILWPDFDEQALADAFAFYAGRQRRFGYTGDQIEQLQHERTD